jgi:FkbM family methyltransferase
MDGKPSPRGDVGLRPFDLEFEGRTRRFHVFDSENQLLTVKEIFSGKTFTAPPIDRRAVDRVFDIGANIGAASLFFALSYPNARVHAFEPNRLSIPVLRRNVEGIGRIAVHPFGLAETDAVTIIRIAGLGGECSSIKSTIEPFDSHPIEIRDAARILGELAEGARAIVMKIDTEGCEAEILQRIGDLHPRIQVVYVEYHSENQRRRIDRELTAHGMLLFQGSAARPHRGDLFYIREEIVAAIPYLDRYRAD